MARPLVGHSVLAGQMVVVDQNTRYYPLGVKSGPPLTLPQILGAALTNWWNADDPAPGAVAAWVDRVSSASVPANTTSPTAASNWTASAVAKAGVSFNGTTDGFRLAPVPASLPLGSTPGEIWILASNPSVATAYKCLIRYGGGASGLDRNIHASNDVRQSPLVGDGGTNLIGTTTTPMTGAFLVG